MGFPPRSGCSQAARKPHFLHGLILRSSVHWLPKISLVEIHRPSIANIRYPLVNVHATMENHYWNSGFSMIFPWNMVIFRSYVSLPEANYKTQALGQDGITSNITRNASIHLQSCHFRHLQFPEAEGEKVAHFWDFFPCVPLHWISDVLN